MTAPIVTSLALGTLFAAFGAAIASRQRRRIRRCTVMVRAEVIANQKIYDDVEQNGYGSKYYKPVYTYVLNGTRYSALGRFSHARPVADVGRGVDILVDPGNPKSIYEPRHERVVNAIAVLFLLAGIAMDAMTVGFIAMDWIR